MKKVKMFKGWVIARCMERETAETRYYIFTLDEWSYGEGYRTAEHDCGSVEECEQWLQN